MKSTINKFEKSVTKNNRFPDESCLLQCQPPTKARRRISCTIHPLLQGPQEISSRAFPIRNASKTCLSEFTQRVMSGKLLQLKQYQNQLTEVQSQLVEAKEENKAINRLLKRHEISLRRYEGENAGIPRLIKSHAEEVRGLRTTMHEIKRELRDLQSQLRDKDAEILSLKDTLGKLRTLAEGKKLFDQEKANKKINELEQLVEEQNKEIQLLSRRILLDSKNHQRQLNSEIAKRQEARKALEVAEMTIERLEKQKRATPYGHTPLNGTLQPRTFQTNEEGDSVKNESSRQNYRRASLIPLENLKACTPQHTGHHSKPLSNRSTLRLCQSINIPTING